MDIVYLVKYEVLEPSSSYSDVVACYNNKEAALRMLERLVSEVEIDSEDIPHYKDGYDIYRNENVPDLYNRADDQVFIINKDGIYYDLYYIEQLPLLN